MTFGGASQSAVSAPGSAAWGSAEGNFAALDRPAATQLRIRRVLALATGVALAGAVAWGILAYLTKHQYSLIALVVGIGIGYVVRRYRRGDPVAAAAAAVLAVVGCVLGTFVALVLVALRDGAKLGTIAGHPSVIVQAYPSSVGSLGIVFWLMAAVAAFTYPMGPQTGRSSGPVPDRPEQEPARPPWASKPVPGGYGTAQAPAGPDDEAVPGGPGWGAQPVASQAPALRPTARSFAEQIPVLRPPARPAARPVSGQMPAARPVNGQMPAARPVAQPVTNQMPPVRPVAQPVTDQMPALRPSAQPPSWDLQPNSTARHRAPQTSAAEPTTGQWAAAQPSAGSSTAGSSTAGSRAASSSASGSRAAEQSSALPKRQRPVGRHRSPSAGPMD
jgi:hypothetical protein